MWKSHIKLRKYEAPILFIKRLSDRVFLLTKTFLLVYFFPNKCILNIFNFTTWFHLKSPRMVHRTLHRNLSTTHQLKIGVVNPWRHMPHSWFVVLGTYYCYSWGSRVDSIGFECLKWSIISSFVNTFYSVVFQMVHHYVISLVRLWVCLLIWQFGW